jgi:hypothetical protein
MLIDCDTCAVREIHCADCVMTVLLTERRSPVELDSAEENALAALAEGGILPPLRLVPVSPAPGGAGPTSPGTPFRRVVGS